MSRTAQALLALAALIWVSQVVWSRVAAHVDVLAMPVHTRRHVTWLLGNTRYIELGAGTLAVVAVVTAVTA